MESNIPIVGGSEPASNAQPAATPAAEVNNLTSVNPNLPDQPIETTETPVADPVAVVADEPAAEAPVPAAAETPDHVDPVDHASTEEIDHYDPDNAGLEAHNPDHDEDGPDGVVSEGGLRKGDIIEGTIVSASPTEVLVDIGQKTEGVIQTKELDQITAAELELLKVGEKVLVFVVNPEAREGHAVLSITRAREEQDWRDAEALRQSKGVYNGKVDGYNKGGLIVRFGRVRGFVPESQISRERRQRAEAAGTPDNKWAGMRGEDIGVKVLEVDRARNRLILSEREAAPQRRELMKVQLLDELQVGDVRVGRVKSLAEFGAFVDVGGADGLVHLTEISWKHVAHPQDVLKVGQEVKVEVISVDRDRKRIGLSIKRQEEDPWMALASQYAIGDLVQGTITKLVKFGAFARLVDNPEIEGLIHITELADRRVVHPRDVVNEGDVLTLRVVKIEGDRRRIGLSLKRVNSAAYVDRDYARATNTPTPPPPISDVADFEAASLRSEEDRRRERRKPAGGGGGGGAGGGGAKKGRRGGRGDAEDDFGGGDY
jgi:small subunit ribosomal protein S1